MFRKRLYEIIEIADEDDFFSKVYDIFMMFTIIASIIPM
jgi:voltage-gated potassium channel